MLMIPAVGRSVSEGFGLDQFFGGIKPNQQEGGALRLVEYRRRCDINTKWMIQGCQHFLIMP